MQGDSQDCISCACGQNFQLTASETGYFSEAIMYKNSNSLHWSIEIA